MWFSAIADKEEGLGAAALASLISPSGPSFSATKKAAVTSKSQPEEEEEESSAYYNPTSTTTLPPIHFVSRRSPIYCTKACVATSQPLATSIGLHILRGCGGNAADASVAIAAALAVLEPCSTGLGGDMFALWYDSSKKNVSAINGSGKSPANLTLETVQQFYSSSSSSMSNVQFQFTMGVHAITVPGAAQGWDDVHKTYGSGRLTLLQILEPAITLAREGFPVSTLTAMRWSEQMKSITKWYTTEEIACGQGIVAMSMDGKGMGPKPGELFRNPHLANVMQSLGEYGAKDGFYNAFPGKSIVEAIQKHGGKMSMDDLVNHTSTFPDPICVNYHGINVWEVPPNGQGIAGLIALEGLTSLEENGLLNGIDELICNNKTTHPQPSCEMLHAQIEMMRLGFSDARAHVCDPDFATRTESSTEWLLNKNRISTRATALFDKEKATIQGIPNASSCTVSFQVVDEDGNAMSFVNSNYMGFGTGLTPTKCGFTLQNRGGGLSLDSSHPNVLEPNKRPYHTIIPAMLTHADTGELYATLSNMGGFMQPQGHMQLVVNLLRHGLDPQTAIDAPRFCILDGTKNGVVYLEEGFHHETIAKLQSMGHHMRPNVSGHEREVFGRAQIIIKDRKTGILCAGSDGRADGCSLGY